MSEVQPTPSPLAGTWGIELEIENFRGTLGIFQKWLEGSIQNFTYFKAASPGDTAIEMRLEQLVKVQNDPKQWSSFCMEESNKNHALAEEYEKMKKASLSACCTRASNGWAHTAGVILREVYGVKNPGERLY